MAKLNNDIAQTVVLCTCKAGKTQCKISIENRGKIILVQWLALKTRVRYEISIVLLLMSSF